MHSVSFPNDPDCLGLTEPVEKPYTSLVECNGTFDAPYSHACENPPSQDAPHVSDSGAKGQWPTCEPPRASPPPDTRSSGMQVSVPDLSAVQVEDATETFAMRKNGVDEVALLHIGAWVSEQSLHKAPKSHKKRF
ncbi:hypothetical protein GGTG_04290 [Gaeumannomyces tritici R3-111a-1]|uniref:Uncharacterized protein n=1 Tax=Gaeumannomyces tritici (strain R3-111a-1) TaxID=644352 RepID=J3NSP1_GAET3|nr:hypothetical protein GGTG_04290 [Gaeumannomyces tritici R3-111a-1]EJT79204.1 hypothetical protein GGTG_04290 [Gaeumannomyces tritici R3-111a-1]